MEDLIVIDDDDNDGVGDEGKAAVDQPRCAAGQEKVSSIRLALGVGDVEGAGKATATLTYT